MHFDVSIVVLNKTRKFARNKVAVYDANLLIQITSKDIALFGRLFLMHVVVVREQN